MASWQRIVGRLVVQILLFFLLICAPEAALADFSGNHSPGGVPAGIKSYSVTGAFLDNHGSDKNYSTVNLEGHLAPSGVLRFSGIAIRQPQGKGFESTASLKVELVMEHSPPVTFVKNLGISTHSVPFEVSAPIVPGKRAYIYLKFSGGPSVRPFSLRMNFSFAPAAAAADPKQEWARPVGNPPPDSIGWMDGIEGTGSADIQIKKNIDGNIAEQPWRQIVPGEKIWLYSGTQIQTKNGCEARIMFNTGARIRLKPNTRFEMGDIQSQRPRATEVIGRLWNGLGNFFFPKTAGGERKFEIEGSRAIVGIKGTTLNIKDIGSATTVQVLEGSVTVRNKASHDSQVVTAGQTITVANSASTSTTGSGRIFDASFSRSNGTAYFIKGNQYIRFNTRAHRAEPGFPKTITSETWPGLPWTRIDAIVGWKNSDLFFFHGTQYARYDTKTQKVLPGYPRNINSKTWRGLPWNQIDAAVSWDNGKIYFFSGKEYVRYDINNHQVDPGYPKPINPRNWPGLPWDRIDAAVAWNDEKVYFFRNSQFVRYDVKNHRVDPGYPQPVNQATWPGLQF